LEKVSGLIDALTADLRDVFVKRKIEKYETGYRSGRRWNIRQRIREKVAGIPLFKTEAREQREAESEEMDYAITLLVDLSGSMQRNGKIQEAFKSAVVLAETLNNLGMKFEVVGFQDILLEFKSFEEQMDKPMREKLTQMILEVYGNNPGGHNNPGDNDDGASLLEASKHLTEQIAKNKFLIVLSDGEPAMDSGKKSSRQLDRELREAVAEIAANTNQKIIGLGLNSRAVAKYYENHIAGITTEEMVETLGELLREVIEKY
jgi:cobaltochelatase CobT